MQTNSQSLNNSRNQFINQQDPNHPNQFKQFYNMMVTMMKNPVLMANMMNNMGQENVQIQNSRVSSDDGNTKRNIQQILNSRNMEDNQPVNNNYKHSKGKDVLKEYINKQQGTSRDKRQSGMELKMANGQKMGDSALSNYTQSITQRPKINNFTRSNPFDQKPIKSSYIESIVNHQDHRQYQSKSPIKEELYRQAEQRPICGIKKNFEDIINQQLSKSGMPHYQPIKARIHTENEQKPIKTFLKKGTRQFLSSAKDGNGPVISPKIKKQQQAQFDDFKNDTIKQPSSKNNRSISQNRVLTRKRQDQPIISKNVQKKQPTKRTNIPTAIPQPRMKQTTPKKDKSPQNITPKNHQPKHRFNVFENSSSSENQERSKSKNGKQVIPGVYLTQDQINQILRKSSQNIKGEEQKLQKLRTKYGDLCNIIEIQRSQLQRQLQAQKQAFEQYKLSQITKIKNEKRVMQRQMKTTIPKQNKQQLELLKKQLEKQKQENKKKDKTNRLLIEKYKKQNEELKGKIIQIENQTINSTQTQRQNYHQYKPTNQQSKSKSIQKQPKQPKQTNQQSSFSKSIKNQVNLQKIKQKVNNLSNSQNIQTRNSLPQYQAIKNNKKGYEYVDEDKNMKKSYIDNFPPKKFHDQIAQSGEDQSDPDQTQDTYPQNITLTELGKLPLSIKLINDTIINRLFRYDRNLQYTKYLEKKQSKGRKLLHTSQNSFDGRTTYVYNDGGKEVAFSTGVRKEYFDNGYIIIYFKNGDIKQKLPDGTVLYYFKQKQVDQITLNNQINIYRFENGQVEFHFDDGRVQIRHPDGTIKVLDSTAHH